MAKRPSAAKEALERGLPEWERCIEVTVQERRTFAKSVFEKCKACQAAVITGENGGKCATHDTVKKFTVVHRETPEAFQKFRWYRDAPEGRDSLANVAEDKGMTLAERRYFETLSSRFNWPDRRAAKKLHEFEEDDRKEKRQKKERRKRVKAAVEQIQDTLLDRSEKLIEEADKMRAYPLVTTTIEKDGKVTIFEPAGWTRRDIPRFYEKAAQLAEFAGELDGPERIIDGRVQGHGSSAPASATNLVAASSTAIESRSGVAEKVQTPQDLVDKILVRIPSHILEQALIKRLEMERQIEDEAQASEDRQRTERESVLTEDTSAGGS